MRFIHDILCRLCALYLNLNVSNIRTLYYMERENKKLTYLYNYNI